MSLREQAEEWERFQARRKAERQGFMVALQIMQQNVDELLSFGEYAKMVHPEDLPIDYKSGMKLVPWERWHKANSALVRIEKIVHGDTPWVTKMDEVRKILKDELDPPPKDNDNPFAA